MKKILVALLSVAMLAGCGGGTSTNDGGSATSSTDGGSDSKKVYNVAYVVNGNLGDKSFFDSAQEGLKTLESDGRITLNTLELGGTDADKPKWLSTQLKQE